MTTKLLTTQNYEQYAWIFLFVLVCAKIAISNIDAQILAVLCAVLAIVVPQLILFLIFIRVASRLFVSCHKSDSVPTKMSFEDMYPDSLETGQIDAKKQFMSCF